LPTRIHPTPTTVFWQIVGPYLPSERVERTGQAKAGCPLPLQPLTPACCASPLRQLFFFWFLLQLLFPPPSTALCEIFFQLHHLVPPPSFPAAPPFSEENWRGQTLKVPTKHAPLFHSFFSNFFRGNHFLRLLYLSARYPCPPCPPINGPSCQYRHTLFLEQSRSLNSTLRGRYLPPLLVGE